MENNDWQYSSNRHGFQRFLNHRRPTPEDRLRNIKEKVLTNRDDPSLFTLFYRKSKKFNVTVPGKTLIMARDMVFHHEFRNGLTAPPFFIYSGAVFLAAAKAPETPDGDPGKTGPLTAIKQNINQEGRSA
ncbi:MAG: hypothetical protein AB1724_00925 [Thermodesulfobacteriota bacterium]